MPASYEKGSLGAELLVGPENRPERQIAAIAAESYSIRRPESARAITSRWICSVPSKMSMVLKNC